MSVKRCCLAFVCLFCSGAIVIGAGPYYVATNGGGVSPYTSWTDAATNIKYAVDVANTNAGSEVIISNGVYYVTEPVVVSNVTVKSYSSNWLDVVINGNYPTTTNRCFIMQGPGAILNGPLTIG